MNRCKLFFLTFLIVCQAEAGVSILLTESGNDVVASGSGTVNLAGLTLGGGNDSTEGIQPGIGYLAVGALDGDLIQLYNGVSGPSSFGTGGSFRIPNSGTGDRVNIHGAANHIRLRSGYTSGEQLSFMNTWLNSSFDSLGITEGTYTWTWGAGANADSLQIVAMTVVPEPELYGVVTLLLALGGVWFRRRTSLENSIV